jgi:hypothetical protein|tara:strand:- start:199 stop:378 length:180 start_codon:yes stop_codon:yes gene_type:complete
MTIQEEVEAKRAVAAQEEAQVKPIEGLLLEGSSLYDEDRRNLGFDLDVGNDRPHLKLDS